MPPPPQGYHGPYMVAESTPEIILWTSRICITYTMAAHLVYDLEASLWRKGLEFRNRPYNRSKVYALARPLLATSQRILIFPRSTSSNPSMVDLVAVAPQTPPAIIPDPLYFQNPSLYVCEHRTLHTHVTSDLARV